MAKKFFPKALSVGLSLALCATMVAPAFAAMELKDALDVNGNWVSEEIRRDGGAFETVDNEDGTTSEVEKYTMSEDLTLKKTLKIEHGRDVEIELNGNTLELNSTSQYPKQAVVEVHGYWNDEKSTSLTITDSTALQDENGRYIYSGDGKITGGTSGGVKVQDADFSMTGGNITENEGDTVGGINISRYSGTPDVMNVELTGVTINNNTGAAYNTYSNAAGGVYLNLTGHTYKDEETGDRITEKDQVTMTDCTVTNNKLQRPSSEAGGMVIWNSGMELKLDGTAIYNNGGKKDIVEVNKYVNGRPPQYNTGVGNYITITDKTTYHDSGVDESGVKQEVTQQTGADAWTMNKSGYHDIGWTSNWNSDAAEKRHSTEHDGVVTETVTKEATCAEAGSKHVVTVCGEPGCNKVLHEEDVEIERLRHTEVIDPAVAPTYTSTGLTQGSHCSVCGEPIVRQNVIPMLVRPVDPVDPGIEIDDPATPLASGPVTRAEFIDYLWRHEGEPASAGVCTFTDVAADHEFILALAWAEQNGIAEAYFDDAPHVDGTFEPDELVTAGAVREFLGNFETVFGRQAVLALDLTTLAVDDEEAVLNCDEVLAEFFGEEYTSAKDEDIDIAA